MSDTVQESESLPAQFSGLKAGVAEYYDGKLDQFGTSPAGVDWNSAESQQVRFRQLARLLPGNDTEFSLLDYGCGYGALLDYLQPAYSKIRYTGFDISAKMISAAAGSHPSSAAEWLTKIADGRKFDYVVASGIFNVRLEQPKVEWEEYILASLAEFNRLAAGGFAFNILTSYSDPEYRKDYLHYADPQLMFEHCMRTFSPQVALLHDYQLYEFTVIVRR